MRFTINHNILELDLSKYPKYKSYMFWYDAYNFAIKDLDAFLVSKNIMRVSRWNIDSENRKFTAIIKVD